MTSEFKTNKISPATGTTLTVGDSGDTVDLSTAAVTLPAVSVTAGNLTSSLDLSGKTVTLPAASVTAHASPTGPSGEKIFFNNEVQLDNSYSIPAATNSMTVGPITVPTGVIVTVPSGSTWVVI